MLLFAIKNKDFRYEDYIHSLFDKQGFLYSTLDKNFHEASKQLRCITYDEIMLPFLEWKAGVVIE